VPEDAQGCRLPPAETPQARAARGETFSLEFTLPAVDGSRRWYEANGQPLHNGRTGHAVVVIGGFVSLAATGRALDLSALIGLVMLRDIVVTNAIVLLDLAVAINATVLLDLVQHKIEAGADVCAELLQGGRTRLRPIPLTAAATILALIPLAPSSDDGLIAASLVAVVIGGLLSSTLLTLVVIPVIDNLVVELCRGGAGGGDLLTPPRSPAR
jgi:hypothetical protein